MIEFKRTGDVMAFECPAFKVEVVGDAERIEFADTLHDPVERVTEAFKILDMMIEHKMRRTSVLKVDFDIAKGEHVDIESMRKRFDSNHINCGAGK